MVPSSSISDLRQSFNHVDLKKSSSRVSQKANSETRARKCKVKVKPVSVTVTACCPTQQSDAVTFTRSLSRLVSPSPPGNGDHGGRRWRKNSLHGDRRAELLRREVACIAAAQIFPTMDRADRRSLAFT